MKNEALETLKQLLQEGAPKHEAERENLIEELDQFLFAKKNAGAVIGETLRKMKPALIKSKTYHAAVKQIAALTGYTDRTIRNWVNPPDKPVEKVSTPDADSDASASGRGSNAGDLAYRAESALQPLLKGFQRNNSGRDQFKQLMERMVATLAYEVMGIEDGFMLQVLPRESHYLPNGDLRDKYIVTEPEVEEV